jgi:hypothetical protein
MLSFIDKDNSRHQLGKSNELEAIINGKLYYETKAFLTSDLATVDIGDTVNCLTISNNTIILDHKISKNLRELRLNSSAIEFIKNCHEPYITIISMYRHISYNHVYPSDIMGSIRELIENACSPNPHVHYKITSVMYQLDKLVNIHSLSHSELVILLQNQHLIKGVSITCNYHNKKYVGNIHQIIKELGGKPLKIDDLPRILGNVEPIQLTESDESTQETEKVMKKKVKKEENDEEEIEVIDESESSSDE